MPEYPESDLTGKIIGAAIEVHKAMGPELLESIYEACLARELYLRGLQYRRQEKIPLEYKGVKLANDLIIDILVEDKVIVEIKSVSVLLPVHKAQIISYMKLTGKKIGLLINFNVDKLVDGIERVVK